MVVLTQFQTNGQVSSEEIEVKLILYIEMYLVHLDTNQHVRVDWDKKQYLKRLFIPFF